ncbi:MAG: MBL fold metallo-hydrolase [Flavobacteriales bacterium]|jgi:glyoxylase-like metal-dependent hydrolase (beta-lactamase superfamily II)|nr:MBL fold metallo-hydrolase [Flavobacteriales bacterium]
MELRTFVFNPFQENTYLIWDDQKNCAIIDPGCSDEHEQNQLASFIEDNGLRPIKLLNTHCHVDHVLGNKFLADKYGLKLEMNEGDVPVLNAVPNYGASFGFNTGEMVEPSIFLTHGDTVSVGSVELQVIHTPGHSPGGICFYHEPTKQVIVGDTLFYGSIGRTDLPGGNHAQLIESIKTKLLTLPADVQAYSGHGPSTNIGFEKTNNPFLQ